MQINIKTISFVICFFFSASFTFAADVAKIGIVDFQRIIKSSTAGKAAQSKINEKGKKIEEILKSKGAELEELKKKLEREALVMSQDMRNEKEREFRIKINDFKMLEKKYKKDFNEINSKLILKIQNDLFIIVKEMGKKEGFLLVLEKNEAGVLYFPNTIDITDRIIKKYNKQFVQNADSKSE